MERVKEEEHGPIGAEKRLTKEYLQPTTDAMLKCEEYNFD